MLATDGNWFLDRHPGVLVRTQVLPADDHAPVMLDVKEEHLQAVLDMAAARFADPTRPLTPPVPDLAHWKLMVAQAQKGRA